MAISIIDTEAWKGGNETETSLQYETAIVIMALVFTHLVSLSEYSLVEKVGCVARHQLRSICHVYELVKIMTRSGPASNYVVPWIWGENT